MCWKMRPRTDDLVLDEGARVSVKASAALPGGRRGTIVSVNADGTFDVKPAVGDVWRKVGEAELDGHSRTSSCCAVAARRRAPSRRSGRPRRASTHGR